MSLTVSKNTHLENLLLTNTLHIQKQLKKYCELSERFYIPIPEHEFFIAEYDILTPFLNEFANQTKRLSKV